MIKYKIGDRVMNVSDSLVPKNSCGTVSFTKDMLKEKP